LYRREIDTRNRYQLVRIRDVAERAGVSVATVSRVLNGSAVVAEARKQRVLAAIDELNYRPSRIASNLRRRQRARMIGVLVSDIENPHFAELVRAIEDGASQRGYRVLLCNTDEREEKQDDYLSVLLAERVAGVILSPTNPAAPGIGELLDHGTAVVAIDRSVSDERADAVLVDNAGGTAMATRHLIAAGHSRIGFVGGPANVETAVLRRVGYEQAMREAGLAPLAVDGSFRIDGGEESTGRLLDRDRCTALITANNLITIGAMRTLRARGLRVPDAIALVAVDDPFWSELVEPPLTTLAQPVRRLAETAVSSLLERLEDERAEPKRLVLDFTLRVRGSCGVNASGGGRAEA
jgi:DNA-binding LacI/PurR family transcriptional regulator